MGKKPKKQSNINAFIFSAVLLVITAVIGIVLKSTVISGEKENGHIVYGSVVFNEMMLSNTNTYADSEGNFFDYAELFNSTAHDISLNGWYIIEGSSGKPWYFPRNTVIKANGFLIVWFCGEDKDGLYTPMKLSKNGGDIFTVYTSSGAISDRVVTAKTAENLVYERSADGSWIKNANPSPMYPNTEAGQKAFVSSRIRMSDPIKITEICASNPCYIADEDGEFSDYIEITNFSSTDINLGGYSLTDDDDLFKWIFPDKILKSGERIVVFASGKDKTEGELHLSFKLSTDTETVSFCSQGGILIDRISFSDLTNGAVVTRSNAFSEPEYSYQPSPNYGDTGEYYLNTDKNKTLVINEVCVLNDSTYVQNGEYFDWIELKNVSENAIDLSNYYLTKSAENPTKWQFPKRVLMPGETVLVSASGDIEKSTETFLHCSFRLDSKYDELFVFVNENGQIRLEDGVILHNIPYGMTYGRSPLGGFAYMQNPTPGSNNEIGVREISKEPELSENSGIFNDVDGVTVSINANGTVKYTLDGSEPNETSAEYTSPFFFTKTTVLRVKCYENGKQESKTVTASYIINENHTLPVVSVTSSPDGLFGEENGICYRGEADENGKYPSDANIYKDWERECHAELIDGEYGFSVDCGIKLFGQSNREYPKQSFQLKFRAKYGASEVYCSLFDSTPEITKFENLVLRSGSQDYRRSMMRDEVCTTLASETGLLVQGNKPCVLYINGEYYGIYYIREKIDEHFIASHENVSEESVDLLVGNGNPIYGSSDGWYDLLWNVRHYDMSKQENYNYIKKRMDVESFADFVIAQAICGNRDSGNIKFYKSTETDNKWRWIFFDLDYGLTDDTSYGLAFMIDTEGTGYAHKFSTTMINELLKNPEFFDMFLRRFAYQLDVTFSEERVTETVKYYKELLYGEIERNIEKWGNNLSTYSWQTKSIIEYINQNNDTKKTRKQQLVEEIQAIFGLDDEVIEYYFYMTEEERQLYDMLRDGSGEENET